MKNNLFLPVLLCLTLVLSGCMKDPECPYADSSDDGTLRMTLSIGNMEEIETRSVAADAERSIKNLMVLVFDKTTGKYSDGEVVAPENLQGADGAQQRTVTVNLAPAVGDKVVILANYDPGITTIPLTKGTSTTADINKQFSYTCIIGEQIVFPMSGEFTYSAGGTATCLLTRSMCKVELNISKDLVVSGIVEGGFTMQHWQGYNALDLPWGAIYSESLTACTVRSGVTNSSFSNDPKNTLPDGGWWYLTEYPGATKARVATVSDTQFHKDRTCLILTTTGGKFYRIDLFDHQTKKFIDMRRNTHITITITKVFSAGYATINEALAAPGSNLEYDIKVDGENDGILISNGSYALSLSNERMTIYTDEKEFDLEVCTARYILPAELTSLPAGITNKVVFRYPDHDNSEFAILTTKITNADTPIKVHVKRKSIESSTYTYLNVCLGSIVYRVPVDVKPALKSGSSISLFSEKFNAYRWIKMAEGVTLNEMDGHVYADESVRWVRYDASGNEIASAEDDFEAVPLLGARSVELEGYENGSIYRYQINVTPLYAGMYAGWFGGDPIGGTGDTGGPRFSKRLLVDTEDAKTSLPWGPSGSVGGIAQDKEQGEAITKLLGAKGSSYAAAYYCYMKNDTNKNGRIDADEPIVWYLPAQNQLMAVWVVKQGLNTSFDAITYCSATEYTSGNFSWFVFFSNGHTHINGKAINGYVRCVRDF